MIPYLPFLKNPKPFFSLCLLLVIAGPSTYAQILKKAIPDKLVVLTFDDAVSTHASVVAPMLRQYGFGGTFYVCEFPDFADKSNYMSWEQIRQLDQMGFEVGNHTGHHQHVTNLSKKELSQELKYIEQQCNALGITHPTTFAYPAYNSNAEAVKVLQKRGYLFSRTGGSRPYDPLKDHPHLIPSYSTTGNSWERVISGLEQAKDGKIVVLTVHGVPDYAHDWVTTPPKLFASFLRYLDAHDYQVIALRDLADYIDPKEASSLEHLHLPSGKMLQQTEPTEKERLQGPPVLETGASQIMPPEWIDKDTGHRIKRLTNGTGDYRSFYFHNNPFVKSPDGKSDLMVFYGEVNDERQLFTLNLQTEEVRQISHHPGRKSGEIVGKQRREVFFQSKDSVFAAHIDKGTTRLVYVFPEDFKAGITTLNADETKLAGTWAGPEKRAIYEKYPNKGDYFERIFAAKIPHTLFTIDVDKGTLEKIHTENTWLGHIQFSPTDPHLLMFCHEGPWHEVDRIWNIDLQSKAVTQIHHRTVHREIAGHEFFSRDGQTIWYDQQIPRGETFYLTGYSVASGQSRSYQMDRDEWSIHFNSAPDQALFCGDGGDSTQVARAKDGMWIYLFKPQHDHLESTRLVNMKYHHYRRLEPNVHFSPDGKWVIFRANFEGISQIYAVALEE